AGPDAEREAVDRGHGGRTEAELRLQSPDLADRRPRAAFVHGRSVRIRPRFGWGEASAEGDAGRRRREAPEQPVQGGPGAAVAGLGGNVRQLPRVAAQVVELPPAVPVLDVEIALRLHGLVRRRPSAAELVLAEILDEERASPRHAAPVQERREAAAV